MGVFDHVTCLYPTPWPEVDPKEWQSKDTPEQYCGEYEIRADGTLWHYAFDRRYEEDEAAPLGIVMHGDNPRWEPVNYFGELEIHAYRDPPTELSCFYSIRFWFKEGVIRDSIFNKRVNDK